MLASITPLGERGRHSHWIVTVSAFVVGATSAGALLGAIVGALGSAGLDALGHDVRLAVLALAALVAIGLDAATRVPGPRRQVNERWLHEFRGWVYGLGYGAQLGAGVTTVVSSAATYVALIAALLVAEPGRGALVMGSYGLIRGLAVLLSARVRRPDQLIALHALLDRGRAAARTGGVALLTAIFACATIGAAL